MYTRRHWSAGNRTWCGVSVRCVWQGSYSHITRRRRADTELADLNESDDGDDEEEDAVKDIIYYPVKQDIDSPVNASKYAARPPRGQYPGTI